MRMFGANQYLGRSPDAGELIEAAERELRLLAIEASHYDQVVATTARHDADLLRLLHQRWGKP